MFDLSVEQAVRYGRCEVNGPEKTKLFATYQVTVRQYALPVWENMILPGPEGSPFPITAKRVSGIIIIYIYIFSCVKIFENYLN